MCGFEGMCKYLSKGLAWWLSWLERRPVTAEVVGSNPIRVVLQLNYDYGILAQLGEHLPYKQRVIGSSPIGPILYASVIHERNLCRCGSIGRAADL